MPLIVECIVTKKEYSIVRFIFSDPFTSDDLSKVFSLLSKLLDTNKPFAFYADTRNVVSPPLNSASSLLEWLKTNKDRFQSRLICSGVILKNNLSTNIAKKIIDGVFFIHPPTRPNKLTSDVNALEKWIQEKVNEFFK